MIDCGHGPELASAMFFWLKWRDIIILLTTVPRRHQFSFTSSYLDLPAVPWTHLKLLRRKRKLPMIWSINYNHNKFFICKYCPSHSWTLIKLTNMRILKAHPSMGCQREMVSMSIAWPTIINKVATVRAHTVGTLCLTKVFLRCACGIPGILSHIKVNNWSYKDFN